MNFKKCPSLDTRIIKSKYDFVKHSKWYWIASCVIVLAGIIAICISGFKLGFDFSGGTVLTVKLGNQISTESGYNNAYDKITEILRDNEISSYLKQEQGKDDEKAIVIKYQDIGGYSEGQMEALTENIRNEINSFFVGSAVTLDEDDDITAGSGRVLGTGYTDIIFSTCVAIAFAMSLVLIYVAVRFGALSGLSSMLGVIHDIAIAFAFVAIFQISLTNSIIVALTAIILYSVMNSVLTFVRMQENLKKPILVDKNNKEIANISVKQTLLRTVSTAIITLIVASVFAIFATPSVAEFFVVIIIGLIAGIYSSIFLIPAFWATVNRPRKLSKVKQEFEIEHETNDKDDNADVVEIK